jgi:two-component system LytT family response regulator
MRQLLNGLVNSFTASKHRSYFLIPAKGNKLIPVQASDISCFCIDAGIVKAFTKDGKSHVFENTLDELEKQLDPALFFRANRQYIISKQTVKDVDLWFNGRLSINLKIAVPEKILVSKARISEFKKWFGS